MDAVIEPHEVDIFVRFSNRQHLCKAICFDAIICVHEQQVFPFRGPHSSVSGRAQTCIRLAKENDILVFLLQSDYSIDALVGRAIVYDDNFVLLMIYVLSLEAANAIFNKALYVVCGQYNAQF